MKSLIALLVSLLMAYSAAHLCMLSPPQRGSMTGINVPGASDCALTMTPCGARKAGAPVLMLEANKNFTVTLQKNLDHFVKATPGHFMLSIGAENLKNATMLREIPDDMSPSLTLYSVNVTLPKKPLHKHLVLQAAYVTMNKDAPPAFYQCADVILYASKDDEE